MHLDQGLECQFGSILRSNQAPACIPKYQNACIWAPHIDGLLVITAERDAVLCEQRLPERPAARHLGLGRDQRDEEGGAEDVELPDEPVYCERLPRDWGHGDHL